MINGKETFIRFLKSIKIENFEDFDMEFLNIGRSKTEDNTYFYSIQKHNSLYKLYQILSAIAMKLFFHIRLPTLVKILSN